MALQPKRAPWAGSSGTSLSLQCFPATDVELGCPSADPCHCLLTEFGIRVFCSPGRDTQSIRVTAAG